MSREEKVGIYERIIEPSLLYGYEVWTLNGCERKRMEAVEMNCLRNICGLKRTDRVPNVEVSRRCGKDVSVGQRIDQGVLRWFGHVERMSRGGQDSIILDSTDSNLWGCGFDGFDSGFEFLPRVVNPPSAAVVSSRRRITSVR